MFIIDHLKRFDWILLISVFLIVGIGLLSIYSSSRLGIISFQKQVAFLIIGFIVMTGISFWDYRNFKNNPYLVLGLYVLAILGLVGLFFFGDLIRGVKSWYRVGPISISPVEFTKIILLILLAKYFSIRHVEMYKFRHIVVSGLYVALPFILVYLQPDLGSALILGLLWVGILFLSGIKIKHFLILLLCAILLFMFAWNFLLKDYQKERIISFVVPTYDPLEVGWSQNQAKIALGNGGLFGKGVRSGSQTQLRFLPEPQTDFIFAAIGEEFGFITIGALLFLFSIVGYRITLLARRAIDNFSRIFILGLGIILLSQLFINIGTNIGYLPVIGVQLPLVSYGGGFLLSFFIGLGILQNIKINQRELS
jgi:rod shape determining protein RodA